MSKNDYIRRIARRYHEKKIAPMMREVGTPENVIQWMADRYADDILGNAEAERQLEEWVKTEPVG